MEEHIAMGYTQYLYRPGTIPQPAWDLWVEDCTRIIAALPEYTTGAGGYHHKDRLQLAWGHTEPNKPPQLDSDVVRFNGTGPEGTDLGHETFWIERKRVPNYQGETAQRDSGLWFEFCKTARKPYDLAVVACLTALKVRVPEVELASDGDYEDRVDGIALAKACYADDPAPWIAAELHGPIWDCDRAEVEA